MFEYFVLKATNYMLREPLLFGEIREVVVNSYDASGCLGLILNFA